uniref:Jacalin-type lectin domain-containing protein n=1 Tax=Sinocyclocheilus anshuiensis TaxID=1608454 RepID=A0A671SCW4_9TELE
GSGTEYSTANAGRITGIRIWEYSSAHIGGIRLSYDGNWTTLVCANYGTPMEMTLLDNEYIVQVSGKYDYGYIYELMFVTSQGRSFKVGQPSVNSFNFYPTHDGSELLFLSGRHNGWGITSIGAHCRGLHGFICSHFYRHNSYDCYLNKVNVVLLILAYLWVF